jgi:ribosomal RNA assembly protein
LEYVKIAEDRVGAVIGKDGEMKARIEKTLGVKLDVSSQDGTVNIESIGNDPLGEWKAKDVVKAISYGVSPDAALNLKDDEQTLIVVNLSDIVGRSKKGVARQKARIIGRQGKTKTHISELTGASVAVKGKHIAIVGRTEDAMVARDAVEALAGGLPHGVVYKAIEKKCSKMKKQRNVEMWRKR